MNRHETDVNSNQTAELDIKQRLNLQTAKITWHELARFFASGKAIYVDNSLDLIDVAASIHTDDAGQIEALMSESKLAPVSDHQALIWTEDDVELWAVVVSPWVLVQSPR